MPKKAEVSNSIGKPSRAFKTQEKKNYIFYKHSNLMVFCMIQNYFKINQERLRAFKLEPNRDEKIIKIELSTHHYNTCTAKKDHNEIGRRRKIKEGGK